MEKIKQTADWIKEQLNIDEVAIGIVLGTGLGSLANEMQIHKRLPYGDIPNFPVSTVQGHAGELIYGELGGKMVLAMRGRFHYYEGYDMQAVVFPIRVMNYMGVETVLLSNASGGVNPDFEIGDVMLITDHINCFPDNPLRGKNDDTLGPRFPDMSEPYDKQLQSITRKVAVENNIKLQEGVYVGTSGPTFETPAEYKYFRIIGGDTVGMSTVPENIAAVHAGMKVMGLSVITDLGVEGQIVEISHEEVQQAAKKAEPAMAALVKGVLSGL